MVAPEEILIRIIYAPDHVKDGKITPSAINLSDLNNKDLNRGCSVNRKTLTTKKVLQRKISLLTKKPGRSFHTLGLLVCKDVLAVRDHANLQAFTVIPTPRRNDRGHAEIRCSRKYPGSFLKKIRKEMVESFNCIDSVDECFIQNETMMH